MTTNQSLLALLADLGRRAVGGDLKAVVAGLGDHTLTMADDIHVAADDSRLSTIAVRRRFDPGRIEVSIYIDALTEPEQADVEAALGHGEELPRSPDALNRRVFRHSSPSDWQLPGTTQLTVTRDSRDRIVVLAVEVPCQGA